MKQDIILAGVGGQGILSIAYVIDNAALLEGYHFKQAEVHGMAQRGGAVQSHLRISDSDIFSDLIPKGSADIIIGVEPLEALRYFEYLSPDGVVVTSSTPFKNIPDYPELESILESIGRVNSVIVDGAELASEAGSARSQNMVILGAASRFLKLKEDSLKTYIEALFAPRGEKLVSLNFKAFDLGANQAT
jgi:indolepyruvate ferredoxin oxidoreductase, beta subunit